MTASSSSSSSSVLRRRTRQQANLDADDDRERVEAVRDLEEIIASIELTIEQLSLWPEIDQVIRFAERLEAVYDRSMSIVEASSSSSSSPVLKRSTRSRSTLGTHLLNDLAGALELQMSAIEKSTLSPDIDRLHQFAGRLGAVHHRSMAIVTQHHTMSAPSCDAGDREFQMLLRKESTCLLCEQVSEGSILHLEPCDHHLCRSCLRSALVNETSFGDRMTCPVPDCSHRIAMFICKLVMSPVEMESLERAGLDHLLLTSSDTFMRCPTCHIVLEKTPGVVLRPDQDAVRSLDGSAMTTKALEHRARHRFRCRCSTEFCDKCSATPYHNGFDCVEFEEYRSAKRCRFCQAMMTRENSSERGPLSDICQSAECQTKGAASCKRTLPCGHPCAGVASEKTCPPCIRCPNQQGDLIKDSFCNICWVEALEVAPIITLGCGHTFHSSCVHDKLAKRWPTSRISFGFMSCPLCAQRMEHPSIRKLMRQGDKLRDSVKNLGRRWLEVEGMVNDPQITDPGSRFYQRPDDFALETFAFYLCNKCKKPYVGGKRQCGGDDHNEEQFDPSELLCAACSGSPASCKKHGKDYIEYKCKFCCRIAVWYCWGTTHFCDACHSKPTIARVAPSTLPQCPGLGRCPLGVVHPPNGTEFSLGCALCRRGRATDSPRGRATTVPRGRARGRATTDDATSECRHDIIVID